MKLPIAFWAGPRRLRRSRAFSLVEVTIALAIAGLGFITLLGLLPQGMEMIRKTSDLSMGSKIISKLSGELQSTSWEDINWTGYGPLRYFNDEGVEIPKALLQSGSTSNTLGFLSYVTSVYVPAETAGLLPAVPGSGAGAYMRRVKICVASSSSPNFSFDSVLPGRCTTCSVLLAKMNE